MSKNDRICEFRIRGIVSRIWDATGPAPVRGMGIGAANPQSPVPRCYWLLPTIQLPGLVNTSALAKFGEEHREKRRLAVPLRAEGTAWDVAWSAVYLASDETRWVTGVSLPIDGGQMALREWPA